MPFLDITGPILSNTIYHERELVAKDCTVTLPSVEFMLAEIQNGGTIEIPVPQIINAMDLTIAKIGADSKLARMSKADPADLEIRWVQLVTDPTNGKTRNVGCKAYLHCLPKGIPEIGITPGEVSETETTYSVTGYRLVVDGEEAWAIDKFANVLRIDGVDYFKSIQPML
ncbi:MAG: phage major tail tube protein [Peptococcaceae bacterium]|nr:phage major tail tube protein [Peptococcaceae bacterium]